VNVAILFPYSVKKLLNSVKKLVASGPHAPKVSTATGTKVYATLSSEYFADLRISASDAADPTAYEDLLMYDRAMVSGQVKSQRRQQPRAQGTRVAPSGLLLSFLSKSFGSKWAGISALLRAKAMIWLIDECRECLPALLWHERP